MNGAAAGVLAAGGPGGIPGGGWPPVMPKPPPSNFFKVGACPTRTIHHIHTLVPMQQESILFLWVSFQVGVRTLGPHFCPVPRALLSVMRPVPFLRS